MAAPQQEDYMGNNSRICLIGYSIKWELCLSHANLDGALFVIL